MEPIYVIILALAWAALWHTSDCKRLKDEIYFPIRSSGFCFRRTNGTHQFGCSSSINGNVGVVHLIKDSTDVDWILKNGPHDPYIAVFTPNTFSSKNLLRLRDSGKISGAMLIYPTDAPSPEAYSDDSTCPNSVSSLYQGTENQCRSWNPPGSNLMFEDYDFPILLSKDQNTSDFLVKDCFEKFNVPEEDGSARDWPLCAVELKSHMYAAVDTPTCIRRSNMITSLLPTKFCDEMGDLNTFLFLEERNQTEEEAEKSVIVVSTQIDAMTMFDMNEFGADVPVTPIVTLLETARLLAKTRPNFEGKISNILFAFFYGEAFDYIGSSRFTYDMKESKFPHETDAEKYSGGQQPLLKAENINMMVELGQIYNVKSEGKLFTHTDNQFDDPELVDSLRRFANQNDLNMKSSSVSESRGLPPSSLHSVLKERRDIPGLLVTDFDSEYSNQFHHSIFDTGKINLDYNFTKGTDQAVVQHISKLSVALAEFLYETASGEGRNARIPTFDSDENLINELLHCYLDTANCTMFNAASNSATPPYVGPFPKSPYPQYVGVDIKSQYHGMFTRNVLALLTGEIQEDIESEEKCKTPEDQDIYEYIFLKGLTEPEDWESVVPCNMTGSCGYCYKTLSFRKMAVSPAFTIEDYDFESNEYSAWAESVWKVTNARLFLKASPSMQHAHFAIGVIVLIVSFGIVIWGDRYSSLIFNLPSDCGSNSLSAAVAGNNAVSSNEGGSNATMVTTNTTDSQPQPAAL